MRTKLIAGTVGIAVICFTGCSTSHYHKSADKEAAALIGEKTPAVPNMDPRFTIEQTNRVSFDDLPEIDHSAEFLGRESDAERQVRVLSLDRALDTSVHSSREYQGQKEILYLAALQLALDRHRYTPIFSAGGNVAVQTTPREVKGAVDAVAGSPAALVENDAKIVRDYKSGGSAGLSSTALLRSGAQLSKSFTVDFVRFLNGDPRWAVQSSLGATLTQPLMRGFGYKVTMENLTQGERDLLYALRDFTLFRKEFSVRIAQSYYGVLQSRDVARNQWVGYRNAQQNLLRGKAFAEEGRIANSEVGLLDQTVLNAEAQWLNAVRNYRRNLDEFKILLGLPVESKLVLDDGELDRLRILHPDLGADDAVKVALVTRLDLQTSRERAEDAARKVVVAANALKPRVDLVLKGNLQSKPSEENPVDYDFEQATGSAGLDFDLGLDRKAERNVYRSALISRERAARDLQLKQDQVKLQVLEDWRALDQAKRTHEISELGVKLAERRVEEQQVKADLGRTTAREIVDAQDALITSQNARITALVAHTIVRLQFWKDMGILFIKENGQWENLADAKPKE